MFCKKHVVKVRGLETIKFAGNSRCRTEFRIVKTFSIAAYIILEETNKKGRAQFLKLSTILKDRQSRWLKLAHHASPQHLPSIEFFEAQLVLRCRKVLCFRSATLKSDFFGITNEVFDELDCDPKNFDKFYTSGKMQVISFNRIRPNYNAKVFLCYFSCSTQKMANGTLRE